VLKEWLANNDCDLRSARGIHGTTTTAHQAVDRPTALPRTLGMCKGSGSTSCLTNLRLEGQGTDRSSQMCSNDRLADISTLVLISGREGEGG
jgi:hypothetical protein